jgi:2-polyprenyl-3-methyl-5-hydroxy-6-metoxy-1,4-benzoquinol methylase
VGDGTDQRPPAAVPDHARVLIQEQAGPGAARNRAARASDRALLLFLGDDMIPEPQLVERHLARHDRDPAPEVAVLGHVRWHPEVAEDRLARWLEWSGAQFDYRALARERTEEAGFGRFYSCNVSLKRTFFLDAGGFDPDFWFDYEDLDLGWRLHQRGMRLLYEPDAVALHLHRHDLTSLERRYASRAQGERTMAAKHPWFSPWFHQRLTAHAGAPPVSRAWPYIVDAVPEGFRALRARAEARADRWYQQRLAAPFLNAWDGATELDELREYLGEDYDQSKLVHHRDLVDAEAASAPDEAGFYRTSELYLYDLTAFAMSGIKAPYRRALTELVSPGARVLDYGCGIGSDGLRLLEAGYRVAFADYENPSTRYLRWRLERRGSSVEIYDLDAEVPGGFDAAFAFDVIEHADDPFAFLAELERRGAIVVVNLLEPVAGDTTLHRPLPITAILNHATRRGLLRYRRYYGRSHLVAYRSARVPGAGGWGRSLAERARGSARRA